MEFSLSLWQRGGHLIASAACSLLSSQLVGHFPSSSLFPQWVAFWLILSSVICLWDASFVLLRPASFEMLLWAPYSEYAKVDTIYGDVKDTFLWSLSIMNLVEVGLNFYTLSLLHQKQFRFAAVMALVVSTMTSSRVFFCHVWEFACGFCHTAHNSVFTLVFRYFLPNGMWIWIPAFVVFHLGGLLANDTVLAQGRKRKKRR